MKIKVRKTPKDQTDKVIQEARDLLSHDALFEFRQKYF